MKTIATILLVSTALVGCGERATPKDSFAKSSESATGATAPCSVLPEGISLSIPYKLASDYYYLNVNKTIRHRVVLQYTTGTPAEVDASIKQSMLSAGFAFHDVRPGKDGDSHSRYAKKGYGMAHVMLNPTSQAGAEEYVVKGEIAFDLPPPNLNPPPKAKKPPSPVPAATSGTGK